MGIKLYLFKFNLIPCSDEEKLILKMKKKVNKCNCDATFTSNYPDMYLRDLSKCIELESQDLPTSSVDLEHQTNMKLDYLKFVADNTSR